jgi:hypothetical protein
MIGAHKLARGRFAACPSRQLQASETISPSWLTKPFESRNAGRGGVDSPFSFLHFEQTENILRLVSGRVVPKQYSSRWKARQPSASECKGSRRC